MLVEMISQGPEETADEKIEPGQSTEKAIDPPARGNYGYSTRPIYDFTKRVSADACIGNLDSNVDKPSLTF